MAASAVGAQLSPSQARRRAASQDLPSRISSARRRSTRPRGRRFGEVQDAPVDVDPGREAQHGLALQGMLGHDPLPMRLHRALGRRRFAGEVDVARLGIGFGEARQRLVARRILRRFLDRKARAETRQQDVEHGFPGQSCRSASHVRAAARASIFWPPKRYSAKARTSPGLRWVTPRSIQKRGRLASISPDGRRSEELQLRQAAELGMLADHRRDDRGAGPRRRQQEDRGEAMRVARRRTSRPDRAGARPYPRRRTVVRPAPPPWARPRAAPAAAPAGCAARRRCARGGIPRGSACIPRAGSRSSSDAACR